jgi:hypothetical protein
MKALEAFASTIPPSLLFFYLEGKSIFLEANERR